MKTDLVTGSASYGLYFLEPPGDGWMDGWIDDLRFYVPFNP